MSTVGKALEILEAIPKDSNGISLSRLAAATGINRTTVHRIISVLVERGYIYQRGKKGNYTFGLKFLEYGDISNAATTLREKALPYLKKLCDEISESVNMAILDGIEASGIAVIAADRALQVVPTLINKYPLHCTSIGKVLLSSMPQDSIDRVIKVIGLAEFTENSITDAGKLMKELERVRREGVAFDDEVYLHGIRSIGAPVKSNNGAIVAAISFVGPILRINKERMVQLTPVMKNCALEISRSLGYNGE